MLWATRFASCSRLGACNQAPRQRNDIIRVHSLIDGLPAQHVLADHFRAAIAHAKAQAIIPFNRSRAGVSTHGLDLYKERNLIERLFNMLKHFRSIATRYEQAARAFLSMIQIVSVVFWTK